MRAFGNEAYNRYVDSFYTKKIIAYLVECSQQMHSDCAKTGDFLPNDEDQITDKLIEHYLWTTNPSVLEELRFSPQPYVHYGLREKSGKNSFLGRSDIQVIRADHFGKPKAFFLVECKRIDGTSTLNKLYVSDGVYRFFEPQTDGEPKYPSYYKRNFMFGYVVKAIDVLQNVDEIEKFQKTLLEGVVAGNMLLIENNGSEHYVCECHYTASEEPLDLTHLFFDFSTVMRC